MKWFFFLLFLTSCAFADVSQPNIIIMLVDDMGVMDSSLPFLTDADGKPKRHPLNDWYRTPNMERLAAQGIRFSQFYSMSVCSPTRISLMTGKNAARHRTTNWINPDQDNRGPRGPMDWNWKGLQQGDSTLASILKTVGYRTIHVGKGHFAPRNHLGADPANLGFDVNVGGASIGAPGSYYGEKGFGKDTKRSKAAVPGLDDYHGKDIFLTEALTQEAKNHMALAVQEKKPFFLYFAHYAVHAPFDSDPRFAANYEKSDRPANAKAFATLIEGMDKSLGDVLSHTHELGVAENTLFFFLGDNGSDAPLGHEHEWACAAPLRGKKGSHYEGGVRVPFIAAWAQPKEQNTFQTRLKIPKNAIQTQPAFVYDLFPTVLGLVGIATSGASDGDGRPLHRLLGGEADSSHPTRFLMHYPHAPHRSDYFTTYREDDWKVIYHYFPSKVSGGSHYQLFNLREDPFEKTDLAQTKPDMLKKLVQGLVKSLQEQGATYPLNEDLIHPAYPKVP